MTKFEASVVIDRPIEMVWRFMTDPANYPKFAGVLELKQTSAGPLGMGTSLDMRDRRTGVTELRIVEYEPNRKLTWEYASGRFKGAKAMRTMESIEGKTRLIWTLEAKLGGIYKLVGPFAAGMVRRSIVAKLDNAKRLLESEGRP